MKYADIAAAFISEHSANVTAEHTSPLLQTVQYRHPQGHLVSCVIAYALVKELASQRTWNTLAGMDCHGDWSFVRDEANPFDVQKSAARLGRAKYSVKI